MFETIINKAKKAKAVAGATVATTKLVRKTYKEINYMIKVYYPELSRVERRKLANDVFSFEVALGMVHS